MKTHTWFCFIVYSTILLTSVVRCEYTWNGSEWVWTENESQAPSVPIEEDGSGGDYNYEDEDEGDSWDEGSGDDTYGNVVKQPKHKDSSSSRGNGGYNSNVYEQPNNPYEPQPNPGYQDPYNNIQDPYGNSWNNNPNQYENQQIPTTKAPWEIDDGKNDIYVDPPVQYPIPSTSSPVDLNPPSNNFDPSNDVSPKKSNRSTSFFAQPGTLAAVIGGAVVGLLCAILCVMFVVYRMRKKDEGSYALDEPKRSPTVNAYAKHPSREFYA